MENPSSRIEYHYRSGFGFKLHEDEYFDEDLFADLVGCLQDFREYWKGGEVVWRKEIGYLNIIEKEIRYAEYGSDHGHPINIDNRKLTLYSELFSASLSKSIFNICDDDFREEALKIRNGIRG